MKLFIHICLLFVIAAGVSMYGIAQEYQGGGIGAGFRDLQKSKMSSDQTNPVTIKKHFWNESTRNQNGIRLLVPQDYGTIQEAIDSSTDGDTVLVSDGTYMENIRFRGKAIVVASLYLIDGDTSHIEQTKIDGSNPSHPDSASVVYFIDGEDTSSVLCGLTIRGGAGTPVTTISQIVWQSGGGILCYNAFGATIIDNRIIENHISGEYALGGGVFFYGDQGFLILERNRIYGNCVIANPGNGVGGGVEVVGDGAYAQIVDNIFERDSVIAQNFAISGGLDLAGRQDSPANGVVRGNVFRKNVTDATISGGVGGGMSLFATAAMELRDNLFEDNVAKSTEGWGEGGGFLLEDTDVIGYGRKMVTGNRFVNNLASSQFYNGSGGAIELFNTLATVSRNSFEQNDAQGGSARGGGIRIFHSSFRLENNIFAENTAVFGGGVHVWGGPQSGTELAIINNTIINNTGSTTSGGIDVRDTQLVVLNSILRENSPNSLGLGPGGSAEVRYSDIQDGWSGEGNFDLDPQFVDTANGDFHLQDISPCIGAGIDSIEIGGDWYYSPLTDMDGNPRPNPSGSNPDMGAWESPLGSAVGIQELEADNIPKTYSLRQNYPNPFNPTTTIEFSLPQSGFVTLRVYNVLGEELATLVSDKLRAGQYHYEWDASSFASGIYFCGIKAGDYMQVRKMILMK